MTSAVVGMHYVIERRIVCRHCSGAKHTFAHTPDGLSLFGHHLELVHRLTLTKHMKDAITNA
jgi:hypothetical protein